MNIIKKHKGVLICVSIGVILGLLLSLLFRHKPVESVRVERDTIVQYDTIPSINPKPKDSALVRFVTIRVPFDRPIYVSHPPNDSIRIDTIEAEIPITQKHYKEETYQAWVSGFQPNLDSIEVYQKTQTITETITITQLGEEKHWGLGFTGGTNYIINDKKLEPFAGLELNYKSGKWCASVSSGYAHESKNGAPFVRAKLSYYLITF